MNIHSISLQATVSFPSPPCNIDDWISSASDHCNMEDRGHPVDPISQLPMSSTTVYSPLQVTNERQTRTVTANRAKYPIRILIIIICVFRAMIVQPLMSLTTDFLRLHLTNARQPCTMPSTDRTTHLSHARIPHWISIMNIMDQDDEL